jgi:hypothetical protein
VDDWFRPQRSDGTVRERQRPTVTATPRGRLLAAGLGVLALAVAAVLLATRPLAEGLRSSLLLCFVLVLNAVMHLLRTRHLGWTGTERVPLPPLSRRQSGLAIGVGVLLVGGLWVGVALAPEPRATPEQCLEWEVMSQNVVLPEDVRRVFVERLVEGGCPRDAS